MAVLKIYKYPSPQLREVCQPVEVFDATLAQWVSDMKETMYAHVGSVGLAAPQVGFVKRVFLVDITAKTTQDALKVIINPVILEKSKNKISREGCLSFPEYLANIKRAQKLTLQYQDETGTTQELIANGFEAVAIQHEMDHLDGILLIDRVASLKTDLIRRIP
ncbi:MAG: peptide deformylase [Cyanobacteria bacterium]|nr:peptide deformylase [Cyanobacteriota bacterium]